jgi:hypothetical protein
MSTYDDIICGMISNYPSAFWNPITIGTPRFYELEATHFVKNRDGYTVFHHIMNVIDSLEIKNEITFLSGLFHDVGKAYVTPIDGGRFPNHAQKSAQIAAIKLKEWKTPDNVIDSVCKIVLTHMFDISKPKSEKRIRRFISSVGVRNIDNWFVLRITDSRSYSESHQYYNKFIDPFRDAVNRYIAKHLPDSDRKCSDTIGVMQIEGKKDIGTI